MKGDEGGHPDQFAQWLDSLNQQGADITELPFLKKSKVQMQKCEKCSLEFCSPINYKRHIRLHHRSVNFDKESRKYRDLLGAFWDKLSVDEVKEVVSLQDISLKEIAGSSLVHALSTALGKPGFWNLPRVYVKAGSKLLEVIQAKPWPVTSQELFSILDDASEGTFLCAATAESVQKYVFDGEAAKIGLDPMNLIACASFLFEQKLIKAWAADKDAEALRRQKSLFEEEEAAKKKQAGKLEKKKLKKLRQKEQKARVQLNEEEVNREVPADSFKVPSPEVSSLPAPSQELLNKQEGNLEVPADSSESPSPEVSSLPAPSRELLNEQEGNLEVPADSSEVPSPEVSSLPAPSGELLNEKEGNLEVPADSLEVPLPEVSSLPAPSQELLNKQEGNLEVPADSLEVPSPEVSSLPAPSQELLNKQEGNLEVPADSSEFPSPEVSSLPAPSRELLNEQEGNLEVPADSSEVPSPEVSSLPAPSRELSNEKEGNLEVPADSSEVPSPEVSSLPAPPRELSNEKEGNLEVPADSLEVPSPEVSSLPAPPRKLSNEKEGNLEVPADSLEVPSPEVSSLPAPPRKLSNENEGNLEVQFSSNEDMGVESKYDLCLQYVDVVRVQNDESQPVPVSVRRRLPYAQWQRFGQSGFHNNQNHPALQGEPIQKHKDSGGPVNSNKIWTRKVRVESDDASIPEVPKEAIDQQQSSHELMIGSLSIPVRDCSTQSAEARDDFENALQGLEWSPTALKAILRRRWNEALAGDHVILTLSPDTESSGQADVPTSSSSEAAPVSDGKEHGIVSTADDQPAKSEVLNSSSSGNSVVKNRRKPGKGTRTKYIRKQKK